MNQEKELEDDNFYERMLKRFKDREETAKVNQLVELKLKEIA